MQKSTSEMVTNEDRRIAIRYVYCIDIFLFKKCLTAVSENGDDGGCEDNNYGKQIVDLWK